jgi:pyruvate dehydrogenase E1 component alpha subunit
MINMALPTKQQLIDFETRIKTLFEDGILPCLVHLSGGNEDMLIYLFKNINPEDWVFSTHRSHYHYLLKGCLQDSFEVVAKDLEDKILRGKSMFIFSKKYKFFTSSVLASTACIAAGVAASIKENKSSNRVVCFLGDAAEEEGHFYEAVSYVDGHRLPCDFIIEDNDRSCDTNKKQRRGDAYENFKWPLSCVRRYDYDCAYPHGGVGTEKRVVFKQEAVKRFTSTYGRR